MSVKERWVKTKAVKFNLDDAVSLMLPILKNNPQILTSYIFGSRAGGKYTESSDIDIAVYTSENFSWEDYYMLYGELTKKLHSDRLDLVWLNKAEPLLSFEIIKTGKILFFRDADLFNNFELKAKKKYYDHVLYLNKHRRYREIGL